MRFQRLCLPCLLVTISFSKLRAGNPPPAQTPSPPQAQTLAQKPGAVTITLDDAIQMALHHNHNLLAARTTIQQSQAEETTANLRPNPVLLGDSQFLPIFQPSQFNSDYIDNTAQFDLGVSYLFERGKKRQHRLQAAKDQTAVTRSQVADNERTLTFNVASQFINVELAESTLELANEDLKSFQNTVDITEARYKAGDIGEDDLLKIKLQLLQFQTDVSAARLARVQGLSDLRQLLGYESIAADYDVAGTFDYQPVKGNAGRLSGNGAADQAGPAGGAAGSHGREQPVRTCRRPSGKETSPGKSTTPTSPISTTSPSSGRCSCRSSIATRARLRAPASPSRRRRSRRSSRTARC